MGHCARKIGNPRVQRLATKYYCETDSLYGISASLFYELGTMVNERKGAFPLTSRNKTLMPPWYHLLQVGNVILGDS